jgi:hypothetical protein
LNDVSEGEHYMRLVSRRLPSYLKENGLGEEIGGHMESEMGNRQSFLSRPYVASFSGEADSLPQWRSYCPSGNGVSIGFKAKCLRGALLMGEDDRVKPGAGVGFKAVDYVNDTADESLDVQIADAIRLSHQMSESIGRQTGNPNTKAPSWWFRFVIERQASFKKHISFRNESEYRITVDPVFMSPTLVQFRPTRSTLVPYVVVSVPPSRVGFEGIDFVGRVVIGPTSNIGLSFQAVEAFFKKCGIDVEIEPSKIPFRDW